MKKNFTDRKRDGIPCVITPWLQQSVLRDQIFFPFTSRVPLTKIVIYSKCFKLY